MTILLVKLFVKNYECTDNAKVRTSYGVLASIVGILCNVLLFAIKVSIGIFINSISIMADAFNNLSDAGTSIISFIGVKLAGRPADKEHPFGHGRLEYISALVVAFVILFVGFTLLKNSFIKVLHPEKVGFSWSLTLILSLSILIKIWLSLFNKNLGNRINSSILKATSADARNDVLVTTTTIIAIIIGYYFDCTIDGWIGLIVSIFVLLSGYKIAKDTLMPLLGEPVDRNVYEDITKKVESYEGIIGCHDLITHNYGPSNIMATIHVEVPNDSDMEKIHETIDNIERDIFKEMGISLVIHMDPVEMKDKNIVESKNMVQMTVYEIEPNAHIHDFRVVYEDSITILIFDLVVPYSYKEKNKQDLLNKITEQINDVDQKYQCVIDIENSYIKE